MIRLFLLISTFVMASVTNSFAQVCSEKPKLVSTMILEESCESQSQAVEQFYNALAADPSSSGYVMLYGDSKSPVYKLELLAGVKAVTTLRWPQFDLRAFVVDEGVFGKPRAEFVIVRSCNLDAVRAATFKLNEPLQKPTLFFSDESEGSCPRFIKGPEHYFEILGANPELKGRIVIKTRNRATFENELRELLKAHPEINRRRLRFRYMPKAYTSTEYWLIP